MLFGENPHAKSHIFASGRGCCRTSPERVKLLFEFVRLG
jgi:hypothetical protein